MESGDWIVFIVVAAFFYLPAHLLPPVLLTLFYAPQESGQRRKHLQKVVVDCIVTIIVTGMIVFGWWSSQGQFLMWPFMVALLPPYYRIWRLKRSVKEWGG